MSIGVVLNGYKRPHGIYSQLNALDKSKTKPDELMLWHNSSGIFDREFPDHYDRFDYVIKSHTNLGVWPRFYAALNLTTDYICIFDDDTIPGSLWLDNCLESMEKQNGLMVTIGLIFNNRTDYYNRTRVGWQSENTELTQVDMGGHAWFFRREWLQYLCAAKPRTRFSGEDMYFSYALQKQGIGTFVPPHPPDNKEMWGSLEPGRGCDSVALSGTSALNDFQIDFIELINKGWKLLCDE